MKQHKKTFLPTVPARPRFFPRTAKSTNKNSNHFKDNEPESLLHIFRRQKTEREPKQSELTAISVGKEAKLSFFHTYRNISRIQQRVKMQLYKTTPSIALLTDTEKSKLNPLPLGMVKSHGKAENMDLSRGVSDMYAGAFSKGLKQIKSLERLDLRGNKLSSKSSYLILSSLNASALKSITLSDNQLGGEAVLRLVELIMAPHSSLRTINLEGVGLVLAGVQRICGALEENSAVSRLNLARNSLNSQAGDALGRMLKVNKKLKVLDLHWNKLHLQGGSRLFEGLAVNSSLLELDLSWNGLGTNSSGVTEAISEFIRNNKKLRHLDLSFNSLSSRDCGPLSEALAQNHSILGLHVLGNACSVNRLGFLEVTGSPRVHFAPCSYRRTMASEKHRTGENCWVCEKWVEHSFVFLNPAGAESPIFLHLSIDEYVPIPMENTMATYKYTRVLPQQPVTFFFSDLQGTVITLDRIPSRELDVPIQITVSYSESQSKALVVTKLNVSTPFGSECDIKFPFEFLPRTPLPQHNPSPLRPLLEPWSFSKSIFKDYVLDTPSLLDKCFEFDWKHSRVSALVKNESSLAETKSLLRSMYPLIKNTFKVLSTCNFGELFSVSSNTAFDFLSQAGVFSPSYLASDFGVNWNAALSSKDKGETYNPGNSLARYEFLELLIRVAYDKYFRTKQVLSVPEAVQQLLSELTPLLLLANFNEFKDSYFCEETELFLKGNNELIKLIYNKYSGRKTLPGKSPFMSLEEFREFCTAIGSGSEFFTARDVDQVFCFSMMTQADELFNKFHVEMGILEFYEALARISGIVCPSPALLLKEKLQKLLPTLINLASSNIVQRSATFERFLKSLKATQEENVLKN